METRKSPWLAMILSLIAPGTGQIYAGAVKHGLALLGTVVSLGLLFLWFDPGMFGLGEEGWAPTPQRLVILLGMALFWLWNALDAYRQARGEMAKAMWGFVIILALVYIVAWQATEISIGAFVTGAQAPNLRRLIVKIAWPFPAAFARDKYVQAARADFQRPCTDQNPPVAQPKLDEPYIIVEPTCGVPGDMLRVRGGNFRPNWPGEIWWEDPIGQEFRPRVNGEAVRFVTDEQGRFEVSFPMPELSLHEKGSPGPLMHHVWAKVSWEVGPLKPTKTLKQVVDKILETIFLALMATTFGVFLAIPASFLAARNIIGKGPIGLGVYYVMRTILNVVRSIEPLVWGIIFVIWVGLGPFAGILALTVHSAAALGKLYSEAIENIDPGPIEAITATGANALQVIVYAVVPQVLPPFISFTLYRWDINVRMSTILGFVGGGGIGFLLQQWIRIVDYGSAGVAMWAIAIVVGVLDIVSSKVREKLV